MIVLNKKDWPKIQWGVLLLAVLIAAGAAALVFSASTLDSAEKAHREAKQIRDAARVRAARADEEALILREKIAYYMALQSIGIIGQEHRLDWIEKIRRVKEARKLINLNYELGPQQILGADVVNPSGNAFDIMASPMKLQMQLLHEDDLLGTLTDIRSDIQGYLRVRRCSIERISAAPPVAGPTPQLRADCELEWITVREKS